MKYFKNKILTLSLTLSLFVTPFMASAENDKEVKFLVSHKHDLTSYMPYLLLEESLKAVDPEYKLSPVYTRDLDIADGQHISLLKANEKVFDVVFAGASPYIEENLRTVYFPIFRGLLSYRVMAIREDMQERFREIETLEDFQKYIAIQGTGWVDVKILEDAGFKVLTGDYDHLYDMLLARNGDFFSRGIMEIPEIQAYNNPEIVLDDSVYIYYPLAAYFFVAPANEALADDILAGANALVANGRYEELLKKVLEAKDLPFQINLADRKRFEIENKYISEKTRQLAQDMFFTPDEVAELVN